jgi:hypothetical protein
MMKEGKLGYKNQNRKTMNNCGYSGSYQDCFIEIIHLFLKKYRSSLNLITH